MLLSCFDVIAQISEALNVMMGNESDPMMTSYQQVALMGG